MIHVVHDAAFEPQSFNLGVDARGDLRRPTRFAPIRDVAGAVAPYLYGGSTLACAIFETVFHDMLVDAEDKFVDLGAFAGRAHGEVVPTRALQLVDLTSEGLHQLRVPKAELIDSASRDYRATAAWAQARHRQFANADGLMWMSRQRDREHSLVLFVDRVGSMLDGRRVGGLLSRDAVLRGAIVAAALRAGVEVG